MYRKFPQAALLCVVPYHVLGMFCQYWHLSIHTAWSNSGMPWPAPDSPTLYVLHVRVWVTRDRARSSRCTEPVYWAEVPVTVPLHAWSGQGQPLVTGPSLVTISSQLVRGSIIITTNTASNSPGSMAKKAGGRTEIHIQQEQDKM